MTGCRKQLPEVESRKEKVRGWGDGDLPFPPPPPLTCPTCPWCHWQWLYPVPASGSFPKGSVGSRGWMCPSPRAAPAAPSLCRHPTGPAGEGIRLLKEPGAVGLPSEWLLRPPRSSPDPRCGDTGCLGHPGHGRDQSLSGYGAEHATPMQWRPC